MKHYMISVPDKKISFWYKDSKKAGRKFAKLFNLVNYVSLTEYDNGVKNWYIDNWI